MTTLQKADAVLAAFRDQVECPNCGQYCPKHEIDQYALFFRINKAFVRVCYKCWRKGVEDGDTITAMVKRYESVAR